MHNNLNLSVLELFLGHALPNHCAGLSFMLIFYAVGFIFFASVLFFFFTAVELLDIKVEKSRLERLIVVLIVSLINALATGILLFLLKSCCSAV